MLSMYGRLSLLRYHLDISNMGDIQWTYTLAKRFETEIEQDGNFCLKKKNVSPDSQQQLHTTCLRTRTHTGCKGVDGLGG
jgi:hypothetical protein